MSWILKGVEFIRRNSQVFAGVGLAITVTASMLPQTVAKKHYKNILTHLKDGEEMPIDQHTKWLIDKILQRILLKPEEEAALDFFVSVPSDPLHIGSLKLRFGACVGIPATFVYSSIDQVSKENIVVHEHLIDWNSETGQSVLNAIVLSDKAKAFAIAREINYAATYHLQIDTLMRCAFGVFAYTTGFMANKRFRLTSILKLPARVSIFSFIGVTWFLLYLTAADTYHCWRDNRVDMMTSRLLKSYAEGGVEFYNKQLQRNQAVRKLLGEKGPSLYTPYGNQVSTWRQPHAQITSRRDNLVKYLQQYQTPASTSQTVRDDKHVE